MRRLGIAFLVIIGVFVGGCLDTPGISGQPTATLDRATGYNLIVTDRTPGGETVGSARVDDVLSTELTIVGTFVTPDSGYTSEARNVTLIDGTLRVVIAQRARTVTTVQPAFYHHGYRLTVTVSRAAVDRLYVLHQTNDGRRVVLNTSPLEGEPNA